MTNIPALVEKLTEEKECECCGYYGGYGVIFSHTNDCDNDDCALAGGIDDCDGQIEPCPVCEPDHAPVQGVE